jgi:biotin-dependent carboxylase-like uncharacterized protein
MSAVLQVINPGLFTTVQDFGRFGHQRLGIPVSGALDPVGLRLANLLVDNPPNTGGLEMAYNGATLRLEAGSARLALVGGRATIEIFAGGERVSRQPAEGQSFRLRRGETVRIGSLDPIGYLAIAGGLALEPFLGSQSTYVRAGLGGLDGRALRAGDALPLCRDEAGEATEWRLNDLELAPPALLRVVLGPQDDHFTTAAIETFLTTPFRVGPESDRMGMRLIGPRLAHAHGFDIVSDGIAPGAVQVPGNGQPILLLADRQTTGGYPKIATVISADLPGAGRLKPGAVIRFSAVTIAEAQAARRRFQAWLDGLAQHLVPLAAAIDPARLMSANLVSGVIDARADIDNDSPKGKANA